MPELLTSNVCIVMMIHGKNFFHSAIDSLKLLLLNPLRTFIVIKIAGFMIVIGIYTSSLLSILFSFITIHLDFIRDNEYSSPVHEFYWWLIIFVYFIVAFAVSCIKDKEMSSSDKDEYRAFDSNDLITYMSRVAGDDEMRKNDSQSMRVKPVIVGE
ncbi:MAG: hypothetical protein EZS28_003659 [Streblomastix strix]|uniref:Choline transporter-like protein n=1 Tax=Streblomastix strix TaxID=222440 RepID=A0A5J4X248_9EUKA|nr:MAG: hypothetical protein EZS28_003659 [Streblomastix strix]